MSDKRKLAFPIIGVCILIILIIGVFYALMFGKEVFQGSVGEAGVGGNAGVQFDFQRLKALKGVSEPQ